MLDDVNRAWWLNRVVVVAARVELVRFRKRGRSLRAQCGYLCAIGLGLREERGGSSGIGVGLRPEIRGFLLHRIIWRPREEIVRLLSLRIRGVFERLGVRRLGVRLR